MAKRERKIPLGWKQGETPEFKPHVSVVRHRDTDVKTVMGVGYLDGHTHARFVANPHCCAKCSKLDGTIRRLGTSLNWIYVLVHPNCLCHWETGTMEGKEFVAKSRVIAPLKSARTHILKASPSLVLKEVTITRNGKTFKQKRWVREGYSGEDKKKKFPDRVDPKAGKDTSNAPPPPPKKQSKPESKGPSVGKEHEAKLKELSSTLSNQAVGKEQIIGPARVPVTRLDKEHYGVSVHGKRLLGVGVVSAAALVYFATVLSSTAAAAAAGDFSGKSMDEAKKIGQDVRSRGEKVKDRMIRQKQEKR